MSVIAVSAIMSSEMTERILIAAAFVVLVAIGTYLIHWLLNAQEWVDIYIRRVRPDLLEKRKARMGKRATVKRILKKRRVVAKAVGTRDKIIEFLAKDKPQTAPVYIYILMSSLLMLAIFGMLVLGYLWSLT